MLGEFIVAVFVQSSCCLLRKDMIDELSPQQFELSGDERGLCGACFGVVATCGRDVCNEPMLTTVVCSYFFL